MYEVFEHTADIGLRITAPSLPELFEEAAIGLASLIAANLEEIDTSEERVIELKRGENDYLMFDWLNELLYSFEREKFVVREAKVELTDGALRGVCRGMRVDPETISLEHEVKAVTYHELKVVPQKDGWLAEVIFDI